MDASLENGEAKVTCDQAFYPFGETQKTELLPARDLLDTCGRMHAGEAGVQEENLFAKKLGEKLVSYAG